MSSYLLDTHTAIWFFNGDKALSETAKAIILDVSNRKYLSIVSFWELTIKISMGKLEFNDWTAGFEHLTIINGFSIIPIQIPHLTILDSLPWIHRDPFDRLLIATALAEQMTLITDDSNIIRYDVLHIW